VDHPSGQCADPARTDEDHAVWREYLSVVGPVEHNRSWKPPAYREAVAALAPNVNSIPSLMEINRWLAAVGWRAAYHSGFVRATEYAQLQAQRIFPIARGIRRQRDFLHSAAPDFVHDLFGHLPMLFEQDYRDLIEAWAARRARVESTAEDTALALAQDELIAANECTERDDAAIVRLTDNLQWAQQLACKRASHAGRLERFYTWCMEFGLLQQGPAGLQIIGGAVLSSHGEMTRAISGQVRFSMFEASTLDRAVNYTVYQEEMFMSSSFQQYRDLLECI
jgi:phenylalanine-4-hydroxylase